jgi:hypothetical protein
MVNKRIFMNILNNYLAEKRRPYPRAMVKDQNNPPMWQASLPCEINCFMLLQSILCIY